MSITCCGVLITKKGMLFDPCRIEGIRYMSASRNGIKLQQIIFARKCMRYESPYYSLSVHLLTSFFEDVYKAAGERTRLAADQVSLESLNFGQADVA